MTVHFFNIIDGIDIALDHISADPFIDIKFLVTNVQFMLDPPV